MGKRDTYTRPYIADKQRFAELMEVRRERKDGIF